MGSALLEPEDRPGIYGQAYEPTGSTAKDDYADVGGLCREMNQLTDDLKRRRLRSRIITKCLPLADHIAYRFVGRAEAADDLMQVARLALIKTIDRYDPDKGPFLGYAVPSIMGGVRRHFRDCTWTMHVPRGIKDANQKFRAAIGPLSQRLGRAPTASEVAAEIGIDREQVVQCADAAYAYRPLSLDAATPGGLKEEPSVARIGAEDSRYGTVEDVLTVAELVGRLTDRERLILKLRFCDDLPQSQIGQRLGVSQVQVSRLLAATLQRLREHFFEDEEDEPARAER